MLIGCDIDGVLFPWADVANEVMMAHFGIPDPGPHTSWEHLKDVTTPEQWAWLWGREGQNRVFARTYRTYPGACEVVRQLMERGHRVHFVTHRDPALATKHTAHFLDLWFSGLQWAGVHVVQSGHEKRRLARWDVFIDDKTETIYDFLDHTVAQLFAPARPWNAELETGMGGALTVYEDPQEIVDWIDGVRAAV